MGNGVVERCEPELVADDQYAPGQRIDDPAHGAELSASARKSSTRNFTAPAG
jgi:hypothetical protein